MSGYRSRVMRTSWMIGLVVSAVASPLALGAEPSVELVLQSGHNSVITDLAFSPLSGTLASGGADRRVLLWDIASEVSESRYDHPKFSASLLAWSLDEKLLAMGGLYGQVDVFELPSWKQIASLKPAGSGEWTKGLSFSKDKLLVAMWSGLYAYDIKSFSRVAIPADLAAEPGQIESDEAGSAFYVSRQLGMVRKETGDFVTGRASAAIIDAQTLASRMWLQAPTSTSRVVPSPNGQFLVGVASGLMNNHPKDLYLWNTATGALLRTVSYGTDEGASIADVAWLDDRTFLVAQGKALHALATDQKDPLYTVPFERRLNHLAAHRPSNAVAIGFANSNDVALFDPTTRLVAHTLRQRVQGPNAILASRQKAYEITVSYPDRIKRWDLANGTIRTGQPTSENRWQEVGSQTEDKVLLLETPGAKNRAPSAEFLVWADPLSTQPGVSLPLKMEGRGLAASANLESGYVANYGEVAAWKRSGNNIQISTLWRTKDGADALALSRDGKALAVGSMSGVILTFDTRSKAKQARTEKAMPHEPVRQLTYSPDGKRLAASSMGGDVWLLDAKSLKPNVIVKQTKTHSQTYRMAHAFSSDNRWFAASGDSNEVVLVDLENKESRRTFQSGSDAIGCLAFTADGRFLIAGAGDGLLRLHDPKSLALVASLVAIDEAESIIVTPDHYYMASRGALNAVALKIAGNTFSFEQFDAHRNRPDIVLERLGYIDTRSLELLRASVQRRQSRLSIAKDSDITTLLAQAPRLTARFVGKQTGITDKPSVSFTVKGEVTSGPGRLQAWVNDVPVATATTDLSGDITVPLGIGRNRIQLSVVDGKGLESKRKTFAVTRIGDTKATTYFVGIGVSRYQDHAYDLGYAAKDAQNLADLFTSGPAGPNAPSAKSLVLLDEAATHDSLTRVRSFLEAATIDDLVVVFIAGHGLVSSELDYFFATHDVDFSNPSTRGWRYEDIEGLFAATQARKRLLLMDTCHSGEIDKPEVAFTEVAPEPKTGVVVRAVTTRGIKVKNNSHADTAVTEALLQQRFLDVRKGVGAVVISSAAGTEFAAESSELKNGVFTFAWREALSGKEGADKNGDGRLSVGEARDFVFSRVRVLTSGQQTPTTRRDLIDNDFTLVAAPR